MIVATNTSSIRIALLIENLPAKDKPRVIGVHFFHPERNITPVVEIIPSTMSSAMSKQVAMSIASKAVHLSFSGASSTLTGRISRHR
jgi:3-hydroxyacyl-CoA dehydrogenase/enoyl-CoA hydratase/3-hydroxybutyryl-CoA epimerase